MLNVLFKLLCFLFSFLIPTEKGINNEDRRGIIPLPRNGFDISLIATTWRSSPMYFLSLRGWNIGIQPDARISNSLGSR